MELVTGATGYVGGLLLDRLAREERPVRALARDPGAGGERWGAEVVRADVVSGEGLRRALDGVGTAYYLVHSLEDPPAGSGRRDLAGFAERDRRAADNFGRAAAAAGVERIVYLGGIQPREGPPSAHLASRLEVERTLLDAVPGSTALRASIMIGAGSSSFRILVRLVERLRFLPLPAWRKHRTRPIDERDTIEYLARTPGADAAGRSLDIAGRDVLSYARMIERIAELMGIGRAGLPFPASLTPAASPVVSALADQPLGLVRPLMESLELDLLPRDDSATGLYGVQPRSFDRAVERALRRWEEREPLAAR